MRNWTPEKEFVLKIVAFASVFVHVCVTFCFRHASSSAYPHYPEIRQLQCILLAAVSGGNLTA